jgi:hypothetical protein
MVGVTAALCLAVASTSAPVVARVGTATVTREMIACRDAASPHCHDAEQMNLDRIFFRAFVDAAARRRGIIVTDAEIDRSGLVPSNAAIASVVERQRKLIDAVRRVRAGEDAHAVYEGELRPAAISEAEFDQYRALFTNEARIRSALSQDLAAEYRDAARKSAREHLLVRKLAERLAGEATAKGETVGQVEDAMWRTTAADLHAAVFDPSFHEPNLKGALHAEKTVALH